MEASLPLGKKEAWLRTGVAVMNFVLPIPSIAMYLLRPDGTVKYFGGTPSPSAKLWCSLTASGDAAMAGLWLVALLGKADSPQSGGKEGFRKFAAKCAVVYTALHCGAFWYHHTFGDPHPAGAGVQVGAIAIAMLVYLRWGRIKNVPAPIAAAPTTAALKATQMGPTETRLQKLFLYSGAILPLPSILLYVALPSGTVQFFGGTPSKSATMWCSLSGSCDAIASMLCFHAIQNFHDPDRKKICIRIFSLYAWLHFGTFLYHHVYTEPHPGGGAGYIAALVGTTLGFLRWGI